MNKLNHVAFIMDGNGRWGKKRKKGRNYGHLNGVRTVSKIVKASIKFNIPIITFYVFSTENWKRPKKEIDFLFNLLQSFLIRKIDLLIKKKIKLNFIGDLKKLPLTLKKQIKISEKKTSQDFKIQVNIALNYGSKNEILKSMRLINKKMIKINEKNIEDNLFTNKIPNPEILIRTGDTNRLSNFMLWQLAYTEIFFEKKLWPDFKANDFKKILNKFKKIKRNFGSI